MLVFYKTVLGAIPDDATIYRFIDVDGKYCCRTMEDAITRMKAIVFGGKEHDPWDMSPHLRIDHPYLSYGELDSNYLDITFCPFCGERVETKEVERTRKVAQVSEEIIKTTTYREEPA